MKRPSFQFYPADWQGNSNLRRCSHEEKGIWADVMCLLHDQEEYGVLRWPLKEIAQAVGTTLPKLKGLVTKGVIKGADTGEKCAAYVYTPRSGRKDGDPVTLIPEQQGAIWYSSRMVRDEYVRRNAGAATRFGAQNNSSTPPGENTDRAKLRLRVLEKTDGHCKHCNTKLKGNKWEIDHLIPRSKGGRHTFDNMVPSCIPCNQDKSDTMPDDWVSPTHSPSHRQGERQGDNKGDGSTSSSSSSKIEDNTQRIATSNTRADQKSDFQIIYDAGCEIFPNLATANTSSIHQWIQAGCHPELDVIPEIKRHKGRSIGAWKFFTGGIMDAKATRETQPPKGTPYAATSRPASTLDRANKTDRAKAAVMRAAEAGGYAPERSDGETGAGSNLVPMLPVA